MRTGKWYFLHIIVLAAAVGGFASCRKENGINNNNVIRTPYGLYFSDRLGALYNTNDGKAFKVIFPTDGYTARAVTTSGTNILMIKRNLHLSADNGLNFNPASFNVAQQPVWQSMILDVPSHGKVYMASSASASNGVLVSPDNGKTWEPESFPTISGATVQSFAQLKDGSLFALDNTGPRILYKKLRTDQWSEQTMTTALPAGATYYLSHFNNALIAVDRSGAGGIYYSVDDGKNWASYAGIPTNQEIYSVSAPFDQVLLAGTDSSGIYRLVGDTLKPSNNGLQPFTKVYGITGKQDMYKNEVIRQYVYIATNNGLFRSEDLGQNWTLVRPGDIRVIY